MSSPQRNRVSGVLAACVAAVLVSGAAGVGSVEAAPVTFTLNYSLSDGTGTASGTFTIDDGLLAPNTSVEGLQYLLCAQITVTVPGIPVQTYTRNDLEGFLFATDGSGTIRDVNFFMNIETCTAGHFVIDGVEPLQLGFFDCSTHTQISEFMAHPTQGGVCDANAMVPTLSPVGLAALALLVAGVALLFLRRAGTLM